MSLTSLLPALRLLPFPNRPAFRSGRVGGSGRTSRVGGTSRVDGTSGTGIVHDGKINLTFVEIHAGGKNTQAIAESERHLAGA